MSVIDIYQTAGSNKYLASCKALVEPIHQPVFDLLLSKLIKNNNLDRPKREHKIVTGESPGWGNEIRLDLNSVAKILYPSGTSAKPARDRRAWVANAHKSVAAILESGWLVDVWTDDDETYFRVRQDVTDFVATLGVPSPLSVPVELYRYRRLGSYALATHAFFVNRMLLVDLKMNSKKWTPDRTFDVEWFCKIFHIPTPREWRHNASYKWAEGARNWTINCLKRNVEFYSVFSVSLSSKEQVIIHRL